MKNTALGAALLLSVFAVALATNGFRDWSLTPPPPTTASTATPPPPTALPPAETTRPTAASAAWRNAWNSRLLADLVAMTDEVHHSLRYGVGPGDKVARTPDAIRAYGEGNCIHYCFLLTARLAEYGLHDTRTVSLDGPLASHAIVEAYFPDGKVMTMDATANVLYPYSVHEMLAQPHLASDRFGQENPTFRNYVGEGFFGNICRYNSDAGKTGLSRFQQFATVKVLRGKFYESTIPFVTDNLTGGEFGAFAGPVTLEFDWAKRRYVAFVSIVCKPSRSWPREFSLTFFDGAKKVRQVQVWNARIRGGSVDVWLPGGIAMDRMQIEFTRFHGPENRLTGREILVGGTLPIDQLPTSVPATTRATAPANP